MWASVIIVLLGIWLMLGPVMFNSEFNHWLHDLIMGTLFVIAGTAQCLYKNRMLSIVQFLLALTSIIFGYFFFNHIRPAFAQNHIGVGLLVAMFAVIPPKDKTSFEIS